VIGPGSSAKPPYCGQPHLNPWPWIVLLFAAMAVGFELWQSLNEPIIANLRYSERTFRTSIFDIAITRAPMQRVYDLGPDHAFGTTRAWITGPDVPAQRC
jgi:hypothetical protein